MSGASGAVVYGATAGASGGTQGLGRYGNPLALGANALIPAGAWFVPGPYTITTPGGVVFTSPGGYCISDGVNVNMTAAASIIAVGA